MQIILMSGTLSDYQIGDLVTLVYDGVSVSAQIVGWQSNGAPELAFALPDGSFPLDKLLPCLVSE